MRNEEEMQRISTVGLSNTHEDALISPAVNRKRSMASSLLAFVCLFGGFASSFVGLVLLIFHEIFNDSLLNQIGSGLMIVSIPSMLLGSIFLDAIEKES